VSAPATLALLLGYYGSTAPPLSSAAMECLVLVSSVRRSLFLSDAERGETTIHAIAARLS